MVLATSDQLHEISRLLEIVKLDQADIDKLFKKNGADSWADLPTEIMDRAIARCKDMAKAAANGEPVKKAKKETTKV